MLGHYHSFRQGFHKLADRVMHPEGHRKTNEVVEIREVRETRHHDHPRREQVYAGRGGHSAYSEDFAPYTVTIPCHHIRIGDILMLQGHPCQVIRISSSSATGQHRYLGVDLFTKQLHEESSQIHNPAPSVIVQTMRGPIMKQYRVLDLQDGNGESRSWTPLPSDPQRKLTCLLSSRRHDRDGRCQAEPPRQ